MMRSVLGVLVAAIVWMTAFFTLGRLLSLVWPDYALHAQTYMSTGAYDFTPSMSGLNASFWIVAEIIAGWVAVAIAKRHGPLRVLTALLVLYLGLIHLYFYWDRFPWWYNFAVVLPSVPAVLLGGKLAGAFRSADRTVAA